MASLNKASPTLTVNIPAAEMIQEYKDGASIMEIAERFGTNYSAARKVLLSHGIRLRNSQEAANQSYANGRKATGNKIEKHTIDARQNMSKAKRIFWLGRARGTRLTQTGYVEFTTGPNKGRLQHVVLMENHIGRRLALNEVVHHINRNPSDNRMDNLQLMTRTEHSALHRELDIHTRERHHNGRFA